MSNLNEKKIVLQKDLVGSTECLIDKKKSRISIGISNNPANRYFKNEFAATVVLLLKVTLKLGLIMNNFGNK